MKSNERNQVGRPKRETVVIRLNLRLHPGEDDDLINFFASLPYGGRAKGVMIALRTGNINQILMDEGIDDDQMADAFENWLE